MKNLAGLSQLCKGEFKDITYYQKSNDHKLDNLDIKYTDC